MLRKSALTDRSYTQVNTLTKSNVTYYLHQSLSLSLCKQAFNLVRFYHMKKSRKINFSNDERAKLNDFGVDIIGAENIKLTAQYK